MGQLWVSVLTHKFLQLYKWGTKVNSSFTVRVLYTAPALPEVQQVTKVLLAPSVVEAIAKIMSELPWDGRVIYLTARPEGIQRQVSAASSNDATRGQGGQPLFFLK